MTIKRILLIAFVVVLGVLLIDGGVRIAGFYAAISTGLTVYTNPIEAVVDAPGEVRFEYSVLSPLMCTVRCEAHLIRHDTNEVIARSELGVISTSMISASIDDESSLKRVPVQLIVSCETRETRYCTSNEQFATDLAIVEFDLDESDAAQRRTLLENKQAIEDQLSETIALLKALSRLETPYDSIASSASADLASYESLVESFIESVRNERYVAPPQQPPTIHLWNAEIDAQPQADDQSRIIASRLSVLIAYRSLYREDRAGFEDLVRTYRTINETPTQTLGTLRTIADQLDTISVVYGPIIRSAAWNSARATHEQARISCLIHAGPCPDPIEEPTTLERAYALTQEMCRIATDHRNTDPRTALSASMNLTLEEALGTYNVSAIRSAPGFASFEQEAVENASRGEMNLTFAERLAIIVPVGASYCESRIEHVPIELPEIVLEKEPITIAIPSERTCALGSCEHEAKTPIIFIHGHSFAQSTDPRYNLQGLTRLAYAFEEHGYLYAGHLFPTTTSGIGHIDAPVTFTATYYVNTYEEDGEILIRTFKSEPIESYALRLREDIEEARRLTGSDQVVIVAHSMGGLVARSYLDLFGTNRVEQLIMIGTPNHGIVDRTQQLCPILGASLECRDMNKGSVFLRRLNAQPLPDIPIRVIAGTGCDEGDGVVELENALLVGANTTIISGECSGIDTLHNHLIDPRVHPEVLEVIVDSLR